MFCAELAPTGVNCASFAWFLQFTGCVDFLHTICFFYWREASSCEELMNTSPKMCKGHAETAYPSPAAAEDDCNDAIMDVADTPPPDGIKTFASIPIIAQVTALVMPIHALGGTVSDYAPLADGRTMITTHGPVWLPLEDMHLAVVVQFAMSTNVFNGVDARDENYQQLACTLASQHHSFPYRRGSDIKARMTVLRNRTAVRNEMASSFGDEEFVLMLLCL